MQGIDMNLSEIEKRRADREKRKTIIKQWNNNGIW